MDDDQEFDDGVVVGQKPTVMVPRHINKKALRNRGISIAFDEKNLRDYVTGFRKRKDKRRKEAQKQLHEKERQMRILARKKILLTADKSHTAEFFKHTPNRKQEQNLTADSSDSTAGPNGP